MTKPNIIALTGAIGAGKTTVANILVREHGYTRVRFAGPLKAMLRALGCTEEQVDGDQKEVPCALLGGKTPRHAMQTLGTEWGRQMIGDTIWLNAWKVAIVGLEYVVVDDCRFPNEADLVRGLNGAIWNVVRDSGAQKQAHVSEQFDLQADFVLQNTGPQALLSGLVEIVLGEPSGHYVGLDRFTGFGKRQ